MPPPPSQMQQQQLSASSFTPAMRDLQARGKNPFQDQVAGDGEEVFPHLGLGQCLPRDTYEARERRSFAMAVLDSPERLMMYAQSEGDSISSQRLRFMRMLCGLEDADRKKREKQKEKERQQRKRDSAGESRSAAGTPRRDRDGRPPRGRASGEFS